MKLWSAWYPDILLHVPGCANPSIDRELRRAAIEFFRRTRVWSSWLEAVTAFGGSIEYDIDIPIGSDVVRVEKATVDGQPFPVLSFRAADRDWTRHALPENGVLSLDRMTFRLGGALLADQVIQIQVTLAPSQTSVGIEDEFFNQHMDDICKGAKAGIMMIPGFPFSNPNAAMLYRSEFNQAIDSKTVDAWRGHTGTTPRARVKWC
jgi:hypothetical protein